MAGRKPSSHTTKLRELQVELSKLIDAKEETAAKIAEKRTAISAHIQQKPKKKAGKA